MAFTDLIMNKKRYVKDKKCFVDPAPIPECVRWSICPKCSKKLMIERIPFTQPVLFDVACLCGCRVPLPEGYEYETKSE